MLTMTDFQILTVGLAINMLGTMYCAMSIIAILKRLP